MTQDSDNELNNESINPNESNKVSEGETFSFLPYDNDHQSLQIGELTFENQTDKVIVYGDIEIHKDKQGLSQALKLQKLFDLMVAELQATDSKAGLQDSLEKQGLLDDQEQSSKEVDNPFS